MFCFSFVKREVLVLSSFCYCW